MRRKIPCLNTRKKKIMKATTHWRQLCFWIPRAPLIWSAMNVSVCRFFFFFYIGEKLEGFFFSPCITVDAFMVEDLQNPPGWLTVSQWVICTWIANLDDVGIYNVQEGFYLKTKMIFKKWEWDPARAKTIGKTSGCQLELWLSVDLQE